MMMTRLDRYQFNGFPFFYIFIKMCERHPLGVILCILLYVDI